MRRNPDFIQAFLDYTDNSESAETIRLWSAIACVASVLERRVSMTWGHTTIYPNLYTIIIAPSGARKGEPMVVARDLLKDTGVTISPERITDEALIRLIADSTDSFQDLNGRIRFQSAVTVLGEELSVFLRNKDLCFMADLTALYDCRDDWEYKTKGAGTDSLKGPCLNILVSSAPDWLPMILPIEAVGGGFTSRCFFIVEEKKGKIVADPNINMPSQEDRTNLIVDLEKMKSLVGEFTFSKKARDFYISWYEEEEAKEGQNEITAKDPKLAGYVTRRATHIKKLGMCLAVSRGNRLIIEVEDLERGLAYMKKAEKKMPDAFRSIGRSSHAAVMDQVLTILKTEGSIKKSVLMRMVQRDLDFSDFSQIEMALEAMHYITRVIQPQSGDVVFKYIG